MYKFEGFKVRGTEVEHKTGDTIHMILDLRREVARLGKLLKTTATMAQHSNMQVQTLGMLDPEVTDPFGNTEAVLERQPDGSIEVQDPFGNTEAIIRPAN